MLYKTFRKGGGWVALPVEAAIEATTPGIRAMLYPESHDPTRQVAEISVLIYHFYAFVIQLPIPTMGEGVLTEPSPSSVEDS